MSTFEQIFFLVLKNINTAQKMKFSIKDFFSKCDEIRSFLRIWLHLVKKSLMENFICCAVKDLLHYRDYLFFIFDYLTIILSF